MVRSLSARSVANLGIASALALFLGACGSFSLPSLSSSSPEPAPEPGVGPEMPASIRADAQRFLQALEQVRTDPSVRNNATVKRAVDNVNRYASNRCGLFNQQPNGI